MAIFDLPTNVTSVVELLPIASNVTSGVLGVAIVLGIAFVSLMITSAFRIQQMLITSSFLTLISTFLLYYLNIIPQFALFAALTYFMVAILFGFLSKGSTGA